MTWRSPTSALTAMTKNGLTRIALVLARILAYLPLSIQYLLGATLGLVAMGLLSSRRRVTAVNIAQCFPELSSLQQRKLVCRVFVSNGIGLIESLRAWFRRPESLRSKTSLHGLEHLHKGLEKGKGVILLGGHYSTLDLAGSLTTLYFRADVVQREHANPLFNNFMTGSRARLYERVISKHDIRGMLRSLKDNHVLWYATDQDYGYNSTVFVPFFGLPCATLVSTMKIAKRSGAVVLPFSHFRRPARGGYDIFIHPALEDFPSGDDKHDAARLNRVIEEEVRKHPEQYLWMHRRFKTPEQRGEINIYQQYR